MLVHHETLIQCFEDQHNPKHLANIGKNHSKYLVGHDIEVEVPFVTGWAKSLLLDNITAKFVNRSR